MKREPAKHHLCAAQHALPMLEALDMPDTRVVLAGITATVSGAHHAEHRVARMGPQLAGVALAAKIRRSRLPPGLFASATPERDTGRHVLPSSRPCWPTAAMGEKSLFEKMPEATMWLPRHLSFRQMLLIEQFYRTGMRPEHFVRVRIGANFDALLRGLVRLPFPP